MHLETLKTFCDLVETGSFSRAAALNFVSQSAVIQQIQALERRSDQPLIERGNRKRAVPTETGKVFYAECRVTARTLHRAGSAAAQSEAVAGTIRVATVYSVGIHELPRYIKQFIKAHPQVKVQIEYSRTDKVYEACLNNTIDFGIIALPLKRPNLAVIPFFEDKEWKLNKCPDLKF